MPSTCGSAEAQDTVRGEAGEVGGAHPPPEAEAIRDPETSGGHGKIWSPLNELALKVPDDFHMHPKLRRQLERRGKDFGPDTKLEWAHAESLALASLLQEGVPVRFTGQDAQRRDLQPPATWCSTTTNRGGSTPRWPPPARGASKSSTPP